MTTKEAAKWLIEEFEKHCPAVLKVFAGEPLTPKEQAEFEFYSMESKDQKVN
jgi:hypothetical protein